MGKKRAPASPRTNSAAESAPDGPTPVQFNTFLPYGIAILLGSLAIRILHLWQFRDASFFPLLMGAAQS